MMRTPRPSLLGRTPRWLVLGLSVVVLAGLTALDASARGGGGFGGGGRGGPGGGGMPGGRGMGPGRMGPGVGRVGDRSFGMGRFRQNDKDAKEWQALQNMEDRKKMIAERRDRLMEQDRKQQQEAYLASQRLASASASAADALR